MRIEELEALQKSLMKEINDYLRDVGTDDRIEFMKHIINNVFNYWMP